MNHSAVASSAGELWQKLTNCTLTGLPVLYLPY